VRPELAALAQAGEQAARLKYSREFEQEADYLGVRYMQSAGYDSRSMLDFLKKLEDKGRMFPDVPPFLQSHPLSQERLNNLEAVLRTQQWSSHDRPLASFTLARVQALIQARYGPPQDVLEVYQMALRERPGDPMRNYLVGVVALETGHLVDAEAALRKARQGGIVAADRELGRLALRNREVDEAIRLLREHLQRRPNDASARGELAKALEISGDPDAARAEYKMAWESAPRFAAAHRGYGLLEGRSGDEAEGFFHLATAARLQGEYEQALEQYKRAQPLLPADDPRSADAAKWIRDLTAFLD
jgi:predicted Zn-dependent protease